MRERERECDSMYVFVTNVLDKGGSLPPNPRPEADRDGNRTTTPTTAPRSTKDLRPPKTWDHTSVRSSKQEKEVGGMGSPRPKGESPREPEATGTLVRFKGPRCPRTTQHPAENTPPPALMGQLRTPEPTSICIRGRGRKVQQGLCPTGAKAQEAPNTSPAMDTRSFSPLTHSHSPTRDTQWDFFFYH